MKRKSLFSASCDLSKAMLAVHWRDQAYEAIHRFQNFEPNPAEMQTPLYLLGRDHHRQFAGYLQAQAELDSLRSNAPSGHRDWLKPMSIEAMRVYSSGHLLLKRVDALVVSQLKAKAGPLMEACSEYADIPPEWLSPGTEIDFDTEAIDRTAEVVAALLCEHPGVEGVRRLVATSGGELEKLDVKAVARQVRQFRLSVLNRDGERLRLALQGEFAIPDSAHRRQLQLMGQLMYVSDSLNSVLQLAFEAFRYPRIPTLNMDNVYQMGTTMGGDFLEFNLSVQPNGEELFCVPSDIVFIDIDSGDGWPRKGPMRVFGVNMSFGQHGTTCRFRLHHLNDWLSAMRFLYTTALL